MKVQFPPAPHSLPGTMSELLRQLADEWAKDLSRPHPSSDILAHWDSLVNAWYSDRSLPLFVRKVANNRGNVLRHVSGRELVPADNSPAHWSFGLAVMGEMPSLEWVREQLALNAIPVAMVLKRSEKVTAKYTCSLKQVINPNAAGWKERTSTAWGLWLVVQLKHPGGQVTGAFHPVSFTKEHVRDSEKIRRLG